MKTTGVQAMDGERLNLAIEAFIWSFPRMLYAKYLGDFKAAGAPLNRMLAMNRMATPDHGGVNVDTLYGVAWLDVGNEPVVIDIPDADDRYYSLQLVDVYANNFAYLGRRTTGTGPQRHVVAGPDWSGAVPDGLPLVRSPSRHVFIFLRTLIDSEADLEAANRFDEGIGIAPLSAYPGGFVRSWLMANLAPYFPHSQYHLDRLGAAYFDRVGDALADDPPTRREDLAQLERFAALDIGPGRHPAQENPGEQGLLAFAVEVGNDRLFATNTNRVSHGWSANFKFDGAGNDSLLKAAVNRMGLGMVGAEEAIYLMPAALNAEGEAVPSWTSKGPDGKPLTGDRKYRLRFPPGQLPPVGAFWSLTMYTKELMLVRNPLDRYAIGDRTPGLVYGADGSLEILIQHDLPDAGPSNWLPAPAGEFQVWIRAYQPRPSFLDGSYRLPPLEIVE